MAPLVADARLCPTLHLVTVVRGGKEMTAAEQTSTHTNFHKRAHMNNQKEDKQLFISPAALCLRLAQKTEAFI